MRWRGDCLDAIERARGDRIDDVLRHVRQRARFDPELRRALLASPTDALSNLRDIDPDDRRALRALDRDARERIAHALSPQALLTQTPGLPWWAVQSRPICPIGKSPALVYRAGSTRKMCQLSGQFDVQLSRPPNKPQMTASTSASSANVRAGDGGLSVQAGDYIYFFFNDVHPCDRSYAPNAGLQDAMAWTYAATSLAGKGPVLEFYTDPNFQSATVDAAFRPIEFTNVPWQAGAIQYGPNSTAAAVFAKNPERNDSPIYLFYTQVYYSPDGVPHQRPPVVGVSDWNALPQFRFLYGFPSMLFSSGLCARTVYCPDWPGLPVQKGWGVLLWGTSSRRSSIHLAFCPLDKFEWNDGAGGTTAPWYFFAGLDSKGDPTWDISDANAKPVLDQVGEVGGPPNNPEIDSWFAEFSMMFEPTTQLWITLYAGAACHSQFAACPTPGRWRGINLRYSATPWGPWIRRPKETEALLLAVDAPPDGRGEGYGDFMHLNVADGLNDFYDEYYCGYCETNPKKPFATCEEVPGGEYAPILIPGWCDAKNGAVTLRWTMSTWRPYQTLLMESVLDIVCE